MAKGYIIQVGNNKPQQVIVAHPDKYGRPSGDQFEHYKTVGVHQIGNTIRVWGRRVIKEKDGKCRTTLDNGSPIDVLTPGYQGEIEFLPWEAEGGYSVQCRYLRDMSRSLDYEYQDVVQKIKLDPNRPKEGDALINLKAGENKFDNKKDALLIQFLKVHPQNRESKSKNPNPEVKGYSFFEITDEHVDSIAIKQVETSIEAGNIVKNLANDIGKLRNLFDIMGKREEFGDVNRLSGDLQIYLTLLDYSTRYPEDFMSLVNGHKREMQENFEKAKSYKALDISKDGHIAFIDGAKPQLILSNAKGKGEKMLDWMIENYLDEEVYNATQIFKKLVDKLK